MLAMALAYSRVPMGLCNRFPGDCRLGSHRTPLSLFRHLAISDQHGDDNCDVLDGVSDSEHCEP